MTLRIANGAGFLGDNLSAPRQLVERAAVDFLTLEYLAELTLSILAAQRQKNPASGFATDLLDVVTDLKTALVHQPNLRIVTNGGGVNPLSCAKEVARLRIAAGCGSEQIGVVTGDDLLDRITELSTAGCEFKNLDTGAPLAELRQPVVCANAYLGAVPIAAALGGGARITITGRVADASLTVGPALHRFRWAENDWQRLAGASVAGHLIECGAQVTGGYSTDWSDRHLTDVGYPIAELAADGSCVITKPAGTGGVVNRQTVSEQLVYEIGDPAHYLTPDVDVDFSTVTLADIGPDRVSVAGARGASAPDNYKVSLAYHNGFAASGQLLVYGRDCVAKAQACGAMILERLKRAGIQLERSLVEILGTGQSVPISHQQQTQNKHDPREVVLRIAVQDSRREAVERFTKEFAPLITSGPAGLAGYAAARAKVRPVFAYWPTLVPRTAIQPTVVVRAAHEWLNTSSK